MAQHIHRIARSDAEPVILSVVTPKEDVLDLEIEGTEGENAYFASCKWRFDKMILHDGVLSGRKSIFHDTAAIAGLLDC